MKAVKTNIAVVKITYMKWSTIMKKKLFIITLTSILIVVLLSACGNGATNDTSDSPDREKPNTSTPAPDSTPISTPEINIEVTPIESFRYSSDAENQGVRIDGFIGSELKVRIPDTIEEMPVTSIGASAFKGSGIMSLYIPDSVKVIGDYAFADADGLIEIFIPDSVTRIGGYAFANSGLTSILLPNSLSNITGHMFTSSKIESIVIPGSVEVIEEWAFHGSELTSVIISEGVTLIGDNAFSGSALTNIILPDSVTYIGMGAFSNNLPVERRGTLKEVTFGNGLTTIRTFAFDHTGIMSIIIPDSVTTIEALAFINTPDLIKIDMPDNFQIPPVRQHERVTGPGGGYLNAYTLVDEGSIELFFLQILQSASVNLASPHLFENPFDQINSNIIISYRGINYGFDDLLKYYDYENYVYSLGED